MKAALMDQYKERNALKTILEAKVLPLADELLRQVGRGEQLKREQQVCHCCAIAMHPTNRP